MGRNEVKGIRMYGKEKALSSMVVAVVCSNNVYVYSLAKCDFKEPQLELKTCANPLGLCAFAAASDPWILACPGESKGDVRVQRSDKPNGDEQISSEFNAHGSNLQCLALNGSGSLVVTASENGSSVKVFQATNGQMLYGLRRSNEPSVVSCLRFGLDDRFLAVATSAPKVEIFKLDKAQEDACSSSDATNGGSSLKSWLPSAYKAVTYLTHGKCFAQYTMQDLESSGQEMYDARSKRANIRGPEVTFHQTEPRLFVLHFNGVLYECTFKPDEGPQDCRFVGAKPWFTC